MIIVGEDLIGICQGLVCPFMIIMDTSLEFHMVAMFYWAGICLKLVDTFI
jgi:hypothetical protein